MGRNAAKRHDARAVNGLDSDVLPFYSDKAGRRYREFSNFYSDMPPYDFILPDYARMEGCPGKVTVEFSEKAIMLVKAGLFKDRESFDNIVHAADPATAKKLGRGVRNFDKDEWEKHLEETAFQCVVQKFASSASLRKVLLQTGDKILAEAAPNDSIWGIGLPLSDDRCYHPEKWCGRNVLGYALMAARSRLRGDAQTQASENAGVGNTADTTYLPDTCLPSVASDQEAGAASQASDAFIAEDPVKDTAPKKKRWARSSN